MDADGGKTGGGAYLEGSEPFVDGGDAYFFDEEGPYRVAPDEEVVIEDTSEEANVAMPRRQFLGWATVGLSGVVMGGLGIPAFAYLADVATPGTGEAEWTPVGNTSLLEPSQPSLVRFTVRRSVGWVEQEDEVALFLVTDGSGEVVGLSNICSHLGCRVRWVDERQKFFCPCHNAVFGIDGSVEEGPPPEPLEPFEVKVEGDQILVRRGGSDV